MGIRIDRERNKMKVSKLTVTTRIPKDQFFFFKIPIYRNSDWFALISYRKDKDIKHIRAQKMSHSGMDKI